MSDNDTWTAPGSGDDAATQAAPPPPALPPAPPAAVAPPVPPVPQYGQYAPPPPPQYGQYQPPQPQYGQYAPPVAGQYAPPTPPPGYGYAAPGQQPAWQYAQPGAQPGPTGWAPPPKPGLIPLRPLGFGTLLGAPFQVLRRNPKATFGSGLIIQLVIGVVTTLFVGAAVVWALARADSVVGSSDADADAVNAGNLAIILLSTVIPLVLSLFASALLQGVLVIEVARATLGEKRSLGELWKAAFKRILPLTGWLLLIGLAVVLVIAVIAGIIVLGSFVGGAGLAIAIIVSVILFAAFGVASVWISTKLALVPSVIVLERRGVIASMRRSWSLTNGNFWRTLGVIWLVSAILSAAGQILQVPFSFLIGFAVPLIDPNGSGTGIIALIFFYVLFLAFTMVISAVTSVVQAALVGVIYIDLRMRKEGLDIELQRFVESRQDGSEVWADPYLPTARG